MVIDCFMFLNELDILEIKLKELDPVVDMFVLIESNKTHTGLNKPYYFEMNKDRFAWNKKIKSLTINIDVNSDYWVNEIKQREIMRQMILGFAQPEDIIILSDLDEITSPQVVREYIDKKLDGIYKIKTNLYKYFLNTRFGEKIKPEGALVDNHSWLSLRIMKVKHYKTFDIDRRNYGNIDYPVLEGGWHFTYCGGAEQVYDKYKACAHFKDLKFRSLEDIKNRLANRKDIWSDTDIIAEPIGDSFPQYVRENQEKFKHLILN